ncbi:Ribonuclease-III-like [seawater metagenome]|uniref:Ribonuclease-III-like n=1 Tax=seawater metagenome TaxID=1561972 RepID=A0A5E8CIB2_9ZZZZ
MSYTTESEVTNNSENQIPKDGMVITKDDGSEEVILVPYNEVNFLATEKDILGILSNNNVELDKINNINHFHEAFTHKSYLKKDIFKDKGLDKQAKDIIGNPDHLLDLRAKSYERLEYLGDRVIKLSISHYLFTRYNDQDEGFMTRLQTKIENKKSLAELAREIGLDRYFIISRQIEQIGGRVSDKILEDCFEAFLGALYLDSGFEVCFRLVINILETLIDYSNKLYQDCNYKDILLRYYHQNKWGHPKYFEVHHEGPPHKRKYIMAVQRHDAEEYEDVQERAFGFGDGSSKRDGEQKAAKMCLIKYGLLNEDQFTQDDIMEIDFEALNKSDDNCDKSNILETSESVSNENNLIEELTISSEAESDSETSKNEDAETDSDYD